MRLFRLHREHALPISVEQAWGFFSDPRNLPEITPPKLGLRVAGDLPDRMTEGMIISYRLHPLLGIRLSWVTEITTVQEPELFVDVQRFGPYKFWHHQHQFKAIEGGVFMTDIVNYALPFGPLGRIAHSLRVGRELGRIFDFRQKVLEDRFGVLAKR